MSSIVIEPSQVSDDGLRIQTRIWVGDEKSELCHLSDGVKLQPCAEAFIASTLLIAMKRRIATIEIDAAVDPKFLTGIEKIQNIIQSWKPNYGRVEVRHAGVKEAAPVDGKTGLFFSAGVDAYYSF